EAPCAASHTAERGRIICPQCYSHSMLRVLIAVAIAIPLYEIARYFALRKARESLQRRARGFAERHGVRVDLFKFGGKALVREELLNDLVIVRAMMEAV